MTAPFQVAKPLPDDVRAALTASIESFGVLVPIIKDQHGRIIDGHHRAAIAADLGMDAPVETFDVEDDEHARTLAVTLNADRRQMSADERRQVVARLRSEGHSLRAIAESHGVSHTTIRRDSAQVEPPVPPAQVEGTDGKQYAASEEARLEQRERIAETIERNPGASDRWIASKVGASDHTVASVRAEIEAAGDDEPVDPEGAARVGRLHKKLDDEAKDDPSVLASITVVRAAEDQLKALDELHRWPQQHEHLLPTVRDAVDRLAALLADIDQEVAA